MSHSLDFPFEELLVLVGICGITTVPSGTAEFGRALIAKLKGFRGNGP
jgi:hypothetical protein